MQNTFHLKPKKFKLLDNTYTNEIKNSHYFLKLGDKTIAASTDKGTYLCSDSDISVGSTYKSTVILEVRHGENLLSIDCIWSCEIDLNEIDTQDKITKRLSIK